MNRHIIARIEGLLLGVAVGDAIGLPTEGMSPTKIKKLGWAEDLKHRFFFGCGMWSDDTEQTIMIAQALIHSEGDIESFTRSFAWELRWWILGIPAATGFATARAVLKLWLGFSPRKSGVWSAGNGAAMRTAPIAAYFPDNPIKRKAFSEAQARLTHTDPKATIATTAITELTALFLSSQTLPSGSEVFRLLTTISEDPEWLQIIANIKECFTKQQDLENLLQRLGANPGKGISGYVYQTFPCVILAGLRNKWDFQSTITELVAAGGDTDTTAAIAGALCGSCRGVDNIPKAWFMGLKDWPTSGKSLFSLSRALASETKIKIRAKWSPLLLARNLVFLMIVLFHGFVRFLPLSILRKK